MRATLILGNRRRQGAFPGMPRYFFDTDDGEALVHDTEGVELADEQAARDEGTRALGEMARDYVVGAAPQKNMTMWVRGEDGLAILQLSISFAVKPLK